jgi:hypothetical protein
VSALRDAGAAKRLFREASAIHRIPSPASSTLIGPASMARRLPERKRKRLRHTAALTLVGWYLMIQPVFSPMGRHPRSFNDLSALPHQWDIWAKFDSESATDR